MEYSLEKKFNTLCQITRAAHFEWRATLKELSPDLDTKEAVLKYWTIVGHDTAKAYLKKIDATKPVLNQLAQLIVDSSLAMGENARLSEINEKELYFEHLDCPWYQWHKKYNALEEDQPGCDQWLKTIIDDINNALGIHITFETTSSLPSGGSSCRRLLKQD